LDSFSRRVLFKGAVAAAATAAVAPGCESASQDISSQRRRYSFFNPDEASFIEAAVARLIPADETGPGALEAAVPTYIDQQLTGAWGAAERQYRSGPWQSGKPEQGYQLPFTPAELFRKALLAIVEELRATNRSSFATLGVGDQDAYLRTLEREAKDLGGVPSNTFFKSLLELTIEGFSSDPIYGGNKGMVGWKLIGFPGAYANYYELVDQHGIALNRRPMSLAQNAVAGDHVHPDPDPKRN
jgi:gluconate 2-dehydrogenase gamma chain